MAGVFAAARDITERKKAEEAARRASAYNRSLIEASLDPLVTINPDGTISDVNEATVNVTGCSRDESDRYRFLEILHRAAKGKSRVRTGIPGRIGDRLRAPDPSTGTAGLRLCSTMRPYSETNTARSPVFSQRPGISQNGRKQKRRPRRANAYNRSLIEASLDPLVTINPERYDQRCE